MFSACSENCARLGKLGSTGRSHATHPTGLVPADGTKGTPRSATPVRARLRIYARWSLRSGGRGSWKLRLIEGELRTDEALRLQEAACRPADERPRLRGGWREWVR